MSRVPAIARQTIEMQAASNRTEVIQMTAVSGRTLLWLKSWLPEYMNGSRPVVLAGRELPSQVGSTSSESVHALCVGPGEWLTVSHERTASNLREHFAPDLTKHGLVLVDLTDGLAALEIRGSFARDVLSKGCGLDLHPRSFPAGRCARTRFAQIPLTIEYLDAPPRFELYVGRSHFRYLHAWLTDAAAEFGDFGP